MALFYAKTRRRLNEVGKEFQSFNIFIQDNDQFNPIFQDYIKKHYFLNPRYDYYIREFMSNIDNRITKLNEFKAKGDMPNYAIEVHALKSDSKYLGFTKLAELAFNHEMKSKDNDITYINDNYIQLLIEINNIRVTVLKYGQA
jgi:hypothetical protein